MFLSLDNKEGGDFTTGEDFTTGGDFTTDGDFTNGDDFIIVIEGGDFRVVDATEDVTTGAVELFFLLSENNK